MLRSIKDMTGYTLLTRDGDIGACADFLFDDQSWTIQYMVANTGGWLSNRKVLLSPKSLSDPPLEDRRVHVERTKEQIEAAPPLASDAPVSKQYQLTWTKYHGLTPYWHDLGPLSAPLAANAMATMQESANHDEHLRSANEVCGYDVEANSIELKGQILGKIDDFVFSDADWKIAFVVVETDPSWFSSEKILIGRDFMATVGWAEKTIYAELSKEKLDRCPVYDPRAPIEPQLELACYDLTGMPKTQDGNNAGKKS